MKWNKPTADVYVPDGTPLPDALARTTHLAVGGHQDDLEIMAFHGIAECYTRSDRWFTGVVCTDGAGSPRAGAYADLTDAQMRAVRRTEQRNAAAVGGYSAVLQLDYPSAEAKDPAGTQLRNDLAAILAATRPQVLYTHDPADKHDTHLAVFANLLRALRALPRDQRPARVYGCEVWRDLDWLPDAEKVVLDCSAHPSLAAALTGLFDSQTTGGKRYDLATLGRRRANATYFESHGVDTTDQICFAMDLTPLVKDDTLDPVEYVTGFIRRFEDDVRTRLRKRLPG